MDFLISSWFISDSSRFFPIFLEISLNSLIFSRIPSSSVGFSRILLYSIAYPLGIWPDSLWFFQIFLDSPPFTWILIYSSGFSPNLPEFIRILSCSLVIFGFLSYSSGYSRIPIFFRLSRILWGSLLILSDFVEFSRFISELSRILLGFLRFFRILSYSLRIWPNPQIFFRIISNSNVFSRIFSHSTNCLISL